MKFLPLLLLFLSLTSHAIIVSRVTEFEPNTKAVAQDLNDEFDNIISALNGNLDSDNFSSGGIASGNIADGSIVTSKLATGAVTRVKMEAVGQQVSTSSGAYVNNGNTSLEDATSLFATITTSGRPVFIGLQADDTTSGGYISAANLDTSDGNVIYINLARGGATRNETRIGSGITTAAQEGISVAPCSAYSYLDVVAAGTYTYQIRTKVDHANTDGTISYCKLVVYEL